MAPQAAMAPPQGYSQPGPGAGLFARAGRAAGFDPMADTDLQDIWARAGLDLNLFPEAFGFGGTQRGMGGFGM